MFSYLRRIVIGDVLASSRAKEERVGIPIAFVIVAANALSSVAYASEAVLQALNPAGAAGLSYLVPISLVIVGLLLIVVFTYDRVVQAYPNGGGAYLVARENLGAGAAVLAAASLLVDYTLTVAVSATAGIAALTSAWPSLAPYRVLLASLLVVGLTAVNLRGTRQSGLVLGLPVYVFLAGILLTIGIGLYRYLAHGSPVESAPAVTTGEVGTLGTLLLLRAFSSGCIALTGLEAISNTVGIFRPPEARNARITHALAGLLLGGLFIGISVMAYLFRLQPLESETLISQLARAGLGSGPLYHIVIVSTLLILVVAANTSFSSFPLLSSLLARDGFLPRPLSNLGERLVYANGILLLSGASIGLIVMFRGELRNLLPLYAIGVFIGFTLSGFGMARRSWRDGRRRRTSSFLIAVTGGAVTGVVLIFLTVSKFSSGAWIAAVAIPLLATLFMRIRSHYRAVADSLSLEGYQPTSLVPSDLVLVLIGGVHRAVLPAVEYARSIGRDVRAVHVAVDEEAARAVRARWAKLQSGIPLVVIPSPYRQVVEPMVRYVEELAESHPSERVTVVVGEFVPKRLWQRLLHNQTASLIKQVLSRDRRVVVVSVPYYLPR